MARRRHQLEPPAAPPTPLPLAPLEPPPPLGSSGQRIIQIGRPEASGSQTKTVRPTAQAMAGMPSPQFGLPIVPPATQPLHFAAAPAAPPEPPLPFRHQRVDRAGCDNP
jgi:hypothetical protein